MLICQAGGFFPLRCYTLSVALILILLPNLSAANVRVQSFTPGASNAADALDVILPPDGKRAITLAVDSTGTGAVWIAASLFTQAQGFSGKVMLSASADSFKDTLQIDLAGPRTTVWLTLVSGGKPGPFTGELLILDESQSVVASSVLTIAESTPAAVLTLDRTAEVAKTTRWWPFGRIASPPAVTVHVSEASGHWPLDNVYVEDITPPSESGFSPKRSLSFKFNHKSTDDLWAVQHSSRVDSKHAVPSGSRIPVDILLTEAGAGTHNVALRFKSAQATESEHGLLSIAYYVRHGWGWAVLVLALATFASAFGTKILDSRRQQLSLQRRIHALNAPWLRRIQPTLPVVWLSAIAHQASKWNKGIILAGADVIEERIVEANNVLAILQRMEKLKRSVDAITTQDGMVYRRLMRELRHVEKRIGDGPVNDTVRQEIELVLQVYEGWTASETALLAGYWGSLKGDVEYMSNAIKPGEYSGAKPMVEIMLRELSAALKTEPSTIQEAIQYEIWYAKLKLMKERGEKGSAETEEFARFAIEASIDEVFNAADRENWNALKNADLNGFSIRCPRGTDLEAGQPFMLELIPSDKSLSSNYLFKHGLEYQWTITITPNRGEAFTLKPITQQPRVAQYSPKAGKMTAIVEVSWAYDAKNIITIDRGGPFEFRPSRDFGWWRGIQKVEWVSLLIAIAVALLSGISAFYLDNPAFGTAKDYVTLFLWGFGVDQGKNFIQIYSSK